MTEPRSSAYGAKGPLVLGVTWTEACLALILVGLRAKTASLCPPGQFSSGIFRLRWDCFWVLIALALALCAQSFMTVSAVYGLGNRESALSPYNVVKTNLWSWIAQIVAILCLVVARIAVISFLLSLQKRTHRKARWLLYIVGALQGVINVAEVVLILKQCDPIQKLWDPSVPGTCDLIKTCSQVGFVQGSIGAAADLILAFYPVYIVGRLQQMKRSLKIGLCLIMGGGLIAGIAGINKTIAIASITQTQDITYAIYALNTWVLTEMWFIIIFGSIPVLRPFFIRFAQNVKNATVLTREQTSRTDYHTKSCNPNDTWVQLDGRNPAWGTHDSAHSRGPSNSRHGESEEEILPSHVPKTTISEGSKNFLPSNYGSTKAIVEQIPIEKSSAGKRQELQREGTMDGQILVERDFVLTYEDQTDES